MSDCNHNHLTRLKGPLHTSGKDYVCDQCGEFLVAEVKPPISVRMGKPAVAEGGEK